MSFHLRSFLSALPTAQVNRFVHFAMEKPIGFWLRTGKAVGETKPTETSIRCYHASSPSRSKCSEQTNSGALSKPTKVDHISRWHWHWLKKLTPMPIAKAKKSQIYPKFCDFICICPKKAVPLHPILRYCRRTIYVRFTYNIRTIYVGYTYD